MENEQGRAPAHFLPMSAGNLDSAKLRFGRINEECPGNTDAGAIMKKFIYMSLLIAFLIYLYYN